MGASSSLNMNVRKILSRWSKAGYYIYIRPLTSKYIDARSDHTVYWVVQVELRDAPPGQWRAEGSNLDECILQLDAEVPRSRKIHHERNAGWMAPKKVEKAEQERFRKECEEREIKQYAERIARIEKEKRSKKRPKTVRPNPGKASERGGNVVDIATRRKKKKAKK